MLKAILDISLTVLKNKIYIVSSTAGAASEEDSSGTLLYGDIYIMYTYCTQNNQFKAWKGRVIKTVCDTI